MDKCIHCSSDIFLLGMKQVIVSLCISRVDFIIFKPIIRFFYKPVDDKGLREAQDAVIRKNDKKMLDNGGNLW